jgi:hypothetical protein
MKKILGAVLAGIGASLATFGTTGCFLLMLDEPKATKSLIK